MTDIVAIQEKLRESHQMLVRLQAEASKFPGDPLFLSQLKSVEKRQAVLEGYLHEASAAVGLELCRYRIVGVDKNAPLPVLGMTGTLGSFQNLLCVLYHAKQSTPKSTAKVSAETVKQTELDFAYSLAGSSIFVFTIRSDRNLFDTSKLDESVKDLFAAAESKQSSDILPFARKWGAAPVRALYEWSQAHADYSLAAEIHWQHGATTVAELRLELAEFRRLVMAIADTSDETKEETSLVGELVGANVSSRTFHFKPDVAEEIRGSFSPFASVRTFIVPRRCRVRILKTTREMYATEKKKVTYELTDLVDEV